MAHSGLGREIRLSARSYASRVWDLQNRFVDRDEVVSLLGLAAVAREHVLVLGPPGTAKTKVVSEFCAMIDTRPFSYLLTRFTEPAEIFGPLSLGRFREGVYQIDTTGMLPEATIAFLDEIFEASSAILNTLLTLVNERIFHNGPQIQHSPLTTLIGSSGALPDDPLLRAFSDRFLLRCTLGYVPDDAIEDVLDIGWQAEQGAESPVTPEPFISTLHLRELQSAVLKVDLSGIKTPYIEILRRLRAEGVEFSDRRAVRAQRVFAASALLAGRGAANVPDLACLTQMWAHPRDQETMHRIVGECGVPVDARGAMVRERQEILLDLREIMSRRDQVTSTEEHRELLRRAQRLAAELRRDYPGDPDALRLVQDEQRQILRLLRERFPRDEALADV